MEKYIREIEDNDGDEDETVGAADLEEEQEDEEQEEAEEAEEAEE